jgi:hypothetical protein
MARCLRCGAGNEWIERDKPRDFLPPLKKLKKLKAKTRPIRKLKPPSEDSNLVGPSGGPYVEERRNED